MATPKRRKRKGKIRIKQSVRLKKNNSGLVGVNNSVSPVMNNSGIIRVRLKHKT